MFTSGLYLMYKGKTLEIQFTLDSNTGERRGAGGGASAC